MSQSDNDGYNGLKAFAFTIGVTVLIFLILYASKRYNPNLFAQQPFSRSYSWYLGPADVPPDPNPARRRPSLGEKPRIWDVWIASWCSHPRPALRKDEGEDEKHDATGAVDGEWGGFLPLSVDKVSDTDTVLPQPKAHDPGQSTSPPQVQLSTIILMPAPPFTSRPSTSSPIPIPCDPPREYVLGTSHIPYTAGD